MNYDINELFNKKTEDFCVFKDSSEVVLYGAGQMGLDASNCLLNEGVNVKFFADKNPSILGKQVNNIEVKHPENFSAEEKGNYIFAIAVVTVSYNIIYDYLKSLGCKNICFVGDLVNKACKNPYISRTWRFDNPSEEEIKTINKTFETYSDEASKKSLVQYLTWVLNNEEKRDYATVLKMNEKYFISEVTDALSDDETFVSYDFLSTNPLEEIEKFVGNFKAIHIFEPTDKKYNEFEEKYKSDNIFIKQCGLGDENTEKYFSYGEGLSVKSRFVDFKTDKSFPIKKLDDLMADSPYSYLKIYGLGLALEAIKGSINTIKKFRPIVAVTIHHTKEDFIEIPHLLVDNLSNYNFYLRLHSYCGFETLFYAIPREKVRDK